MCHAGKARLARWGGIGIGPGFAAVVWQHVADDHEVLVVSMFAIETPDFSKLAMPRAAALCGCSIL